MANRQAGEGVTRKLADFYATLDYENLPPTTIDRAKYFCLDYLSVAIRGATTQSSEAMQRAVRGLSHDGESVIMGTTQRAAPEYAALANGTAAHSLEVDDVINQASLHPAVATFPAAFACADLERVPGRRFITSIVAGYDLMIRLGTALDPRKHYARGFHPTGTCGTFAAAAVATSLMGLDEKHTAWAFGIAGSQAAGSLEFLADGAWTKRMHPGWASHSGIIAALMAKEDFVGPTTIFEGKNGFLHGYSDDVDPSEAIEGLGVEYLIERVGIKPHACCRYSQGPIDCVLKIVREHQLKPDDVESVTIGLMKAGVKVVGAPEDKKRDPQNVVDAQFSMPYGAAVAVFYGDALLDRYTDETIAMPEIKQLMSRVRSVHDPVLEENYPLRWPAWAEIVTRDGRALRADVEFPKGDPENALSWDELKDKFRGLTRPLMASGRQEEIIAAVDSLQELEDIRALADMTAV
jgi:2-methylcitrate dehydratase PrpD